MVIGSSIFLSCSSTLFGLFMVRCHSSILNKDRTVKSEEEKSVTVTSMSMLMMEHDPLQGTTELSAYWHIQNTVKSLLMDTSVTLTSLYYGEYTMSSFNCNICTLKKLSLISHLSNTNYEYQIQKSHATILTNLV